MRIGILSAGDRNNYGDILFPIIFQKYFENVAKIEFENYGIVEADLEYFGGFKSRKIFDISKKEIDIIVVSGGETLAASWTNILLSYERKEYINFLLRVIRKIFGLKGDIFNRNIILKLNKEKRKIFEKYSMPFDIPKDILKKEVKIIYNSIGGSGIDSLPKGYQNEIKKVLASADYISVRDKKTKQNLENLEINMPVKSYPDSAMLMSEIFMKESLKKLVSTYFKVNYFQILDQKEYITFQIAEYYAKGKIEKIVEELEKIYKNRKIKIVLLPIGLAAYHSDQIPLKEIYKKLKGKIDIVYIDAKNIYDIMYVLANTSLYIGTSLHGAITAFSFGQRHVALTNRVSKLREFLKTWSLGDEYVEIENISSNLDLYLSQDIKEIKRKSEVARKKVKENYEQIRKIMLG